MSTLEEREEFRYNPLMYLTPKLYGDYSPFYITITVFTIFGIFLILINAICGCCSNNREYWCGKHTGNKWLFFGSFWTATPRHHPPADLSELKDKAIYDAYDYAEKGNTAEYSVLGRDSPPSQPRQPLVEPKTKPMEYVEMRSRESEI